MKTPPKKQMSDEAFNASAHAAATEAAVMECLGAKPTRTPAQLRADIPTGDLKAALRKLHAGRKIKAHTTVVFWSLA